MKFIGIKIFTDRYLSLSGLVRKGARGCKVQGGAGEVHAANQLLVNYLISVAPWKWTFAGDIRMSAAVHGSQLVDTSSYSPLPPPSGKLARKTSGQVALWLLVLVEPPAVYLRAGSLGTSVGGR